MEEISAGGSSIVTRLVSCEEENVGVELGYREGLMWRVRVVDHMEHSDIIATLHVEQRVDFMRLQRPF